MKGEGVIGYDHEALRRNIETLPKDLWFPPPEPRITNLMERLSNKARGFLSRFNIKYVDLVFIIISGVKTSINNMLNWIDDLADRQVELTNKKLTLSQVIVRSYGLPGNCSGSYRVSVTFLRNYSLFLITSNPLNAIK